MNGSSSWNPTLFYFSSDFSFFGS